MEEEGLSQRDAVDWVVQIVTLVQLHLDTERRSGDKTLVKLWSNHRNVDGTIPTDSVGRCSGDVWTFPLRSN